MQSLLDICSPVVSRIWARRNPPYQTPKLNTLACLPVELMLSITDFLPLDDWICTSLCSLRLFVIFNHRTNCARPSGKDKLPVLRRLVLKRYLTPKLELTPNTRGALKAPLSFRPTQRSARRHRDFEAPSSTCTCDKYSTDSRIEVCEYGSDLALVLTTWINLDPGLTLDDPRWKFHGKSSRLTKVTLDPNERKDSPRVYFEIVSSRSLAALRSCNLSYLRDQQYKKVMLRIYLGKRAWNLPNKISWENYWFMF
ncbi:hypothetical protein N7448_000523 [Penicillium atrosanguineum]|uniref:Plasma membrane ATPase n=1 Tax=Penicillium atrosanguineum TaxID=1132637 RepID=UPI00239EC67A|nr:Plasma membrane ATPase [Penicillium atrosanguineum]KAJ5148945.1 hypothetical protein N7448_000523 [Penicillium atrosanguineum]KAJ5304261.1 Plasma membrane ATPase [Penicillium atrosanguineum]